MKNGYKDLLKAHLNVAWLRPESALWDTIASILISKYRIVSPSLDIGCGNGIFSFITAGGNFSLDYDWYINVTTEGYWKNKDIYDVYKIKSLGKFIVKNPQYTFTYGLDRKPNLLKQAESLGFYEKLVEYDANRCLPFEDGWFRTVFSNILHWSDDLKKSLKGIHRILDKDGIAILCLPNTKFLEYCFTYQWEKKKSELLHLINRGRSGCIQWVISYSDFSNIARKIGFEVIEHFYYLSPLTLKIWDIGLRPFSPLLIKMANSLNKEERRAIKKEWIDTCINFLAPLYQMERRSKTEGGFHLFVLRK